MPLGHDVPRQHVAQVRGAEDFLEPSEFRRLNDPGLVGEYVQSAAHCRLNEIDLGSVSTREDDRVARLFAEETVQPVGASTQIHFPGVGSSGRELKAVIRSM